MERSIVLAVTVFALACLIGLSPFVLDELALNEQSQSLNTSATVIAEDNTENLSVGISVDRNLTYGNAPEGTNVTKYMNLSSNKDVIIEIDSKGNISEFLKYEDRHYFSGNKDIPLMLTAEQPGYYSGEVDLSIYTSENQVGDRWIKFKGEHLPISNPLNSVTQ